MQDFRNILNENPAIALVIDPVDGSIVDANLAAVAFYGYSYEELCSKNLTTLTLLTSEDISKKINPDDFQKVDFQNHYLKNNTLRYVQCLNSLINYNSQPYFLKIIQDITDNERNQRFKDFIFEVNQLIITSNNIEEIFRGVCKTAVEKGGFLLASICTPNAGKNQIEPVIWAGKEEGYLNNINFSTESNEPFGKGPLGIAYNSKRFYYCNDIEHDPIMEPWRIEALSRGFRSSIAIPIILDNAVVSLLSIYNLHPNYFNGQEVNILVLIASNIAYAISKLTTEEERKLLEENEKLIKTVLDDSTALIGIADKDRNIIFWNKALRELLGESIYKRGKYQLEEIYQGEHLVNRLNDDWALKSQDSWSGESELMGVKKSVPVYQVFKRHKIGDKIILSLTAIDITEVKKAREEIADFKEMVENSPAFISKYDKNRHMLYANNALRKQLEISEDENINHYTIENFREKKSRLDDNIRRAMFEQGKWSGEDVFKSKSGKKITVAEVVVSHHNSVGEYTGSSITAIDITAIKQSKQQIENLFKMMESSPSFILMTDINFYLIYANAAFKKAIGYESDESFQKVNLLDIIDVEQDKLRQEIISAIYEVGHWTGETSFYSKLGKKTTIWMTVILNRDEQGYINSIAITGIDISVRKEIEKQKFMNKLKSEFVSFASHEIRTPLAAIRSSTELIELILSKNESKEKDLINRHLGNISIEIDRLAIMVEKILTLEKTESGNIGLKKTKLDLVVFIKEIIDNLHETNHGEIEFFTIGRAKLFETDPILLGHVLNNLLSNADKYSKGKPSPQVFLKHKMHEIEIEIKDFGIGIPKNEIGSLFNSFFRASNTTGISGTGIGLTIVKNFVEVLNGTIKIESQEGLGTQIHLCFPT